MAAFAARTRPGPPTNGRYSLSDTVPDSNGVVWLCVKGGWAGGGVFDSDGAQFMANPATLDQVSTIGVGAVNGATVSAVEYATGPVHKTVLTLAATPQVIPDALPLLGTKIYDFPAGRILFLGCLFSLAPTTTTAIASTINSGVAGAVALGSVAANADVALTSTEADMAPSTVIATSTVIAVAAAAVTGQLAAAAQFDGTSTAVDMFLNSSITTATDIDADGTITWAGTITFHWINLGDI